MNHSIRSSRFFPGQFLATLGIVFILQGTVAAQPAAASRASLPAEVRAAQRKASFDQSYALFASGDVAGGEGTLLGGNREQPRTLGWSLESANKLAQMALRLRAHYDYRGATVVATRALAILQEAKSLPGFRADPKRLGEWHELNGFIHERILGNSEAAKASYQQALQANAGSLKAKDELGRIAEAEATHARTGAKGGNK